MNSKVKLKNWHINIVYTNFVWQNLVQSITVIAECNSQICWYLQWNWWKKCFLNFEFLEFEFEILGSGSVAKYDVYLCHFNSFIKVNNIFSFRMNLKTVSKIKEIKTMKISSKSVSIFLKLWFWQKETLNSRIKAKSNHNGNWGIVYIYSSTSTYILWKKCEKYINTLTKTFFLSIGLTTSPTYDPCSWSNCNSSRSIRTKIRS